MLTARKSFLFVFLLFLLALTACNYPSAPQETQLAPDLIYTAAAQTVTARLTQAATGIVPTTQVSTPNSPDPTATQQQSSQPTNTSAPPTQAQPTNRPDPTATTASPTAVPIPCNRMQFIKDVNYPDDTELAPGTVFDKTWRIKNTGSCTWNSNYVLIFDHGDALSAPASVQLTNGTVPPDTEVDVTVKGMKAPDQPGSYQGFWKLRDGTGYVFGIGDAGKAFWVKIKSLQPVGYDFLAKAKDAEWRNASGTFSFGDRDPDDPGVAAYVENIKLEDGKTYAKVLATYPQFANDGLISGLYPSYTVKDGEHFRSQFGFRPDCTGANVKIQMYYQEGGNSTLLKEWTKSCDGKLLDMDYDLSALKDKSVQFKFVVSTNGAPTADKPLWVDPRIQK
jgi:hypothetical protein